MICVETMTVCPKTVTLKLGSWYYGARAVVFPDNADCTDVEWCSDKENVVAVNESSGYIYAKNPGTARVYAHTKDGSDIYDYITVTVQDKIYVSSIELCPTSISIAKDDCVQLSATVLPENATRRSLNWTSSKPSIAAVYEGKVCGINEGTAIITATATDGSGKSATCQVTVASTVLVESITVYPATKTLEYGKGDFLHATVCPENAVNKTVEWSSRDPDIVVVSPTEGIVYGKDAETTTVYATATDGSGVQGSSEVTVTPFVAVECVKISSENEVMNVGDTLQLTACVCPENATNKSIRWSSSNEEVATVDYYTGKVTAKKAGIVNIIAKVANGVLSACCELWVKGKTPVFLIHGRISHSDATWGIKTNIPSGANNDFDPSIDAEFSKGKKYIEVDSQKIVDVVASDYDNAEKPCNLGFELQSAGYKENINLFAFNYPNEDAVVHSAEKFKKYIENLISYVRTSGSNEMKACFYASKNDYIEENHKINIVAHSMGGLVSRYYIENLGQDTHVDKLITICTPHWGSGYADLSNWTSIEHKLCDHDLDFDSVMFGGNNPNDYKFDENGCKILINERKCINHAYELSNELKYSTSRRTRYYAIAGIDYDAAYVNLNDHTFEMPTNFTTSQQITDYLVSKNVYKVSGKDLQIITKPYPSSIGDNLVGFLSQIGWIGDSNNVNTPEPRIQMEKIFVDVDTNGGNGGGIFVVEILPDGSNIFHSKVNHRQPVCAKVIEYLED